MHPQRQVVAVTPLITFQAAEQADEQAHTDGLVMPFDVSEMKLQSFQVEGLPMDYADLWARYQQAQAEIQALKQGFQAFLELQIGVHQDRLYELIGQVPPRYQTKEEN